MGEKYSAPEVLIPLVLGECLGELVEHLPIERISFLRPIEPNPKDPALSLSTDLRHVFLLSAPSVKDGSPERLHTCSVPSVSSTPRHRLGESMARGAFAF